MADTERKKIFGVRFPLSIHKLLTHISVDRDVSMSDLIVVEMAKWANAQPETEKYGVVEVPGVSKPGPKKEKKEKSPAAKKKSKAA